MRLFVTGALGFIGSYLSDRFDVVSYDLKEGHDIRYYELLLKFIQKNIEQRNIDAVVHLAGTTSVIDSLKNPKEDFEINVAGTFNVMRACMNQNIKKVIYISSAAAYFPEKSPYGKHKFLAEEIARMFSEFLNVSILRLFNVYGHRNDKGAIYRFMNDDPIILYGGSQTRDFVHVNDVIDAIEYALNKDLPVEFDVATGKSIFMEEIASWFNNPIIKKPRIEGEIEFSRAQNLPKDWKAKIDLKEWIKKNTNATI